MVRQAPTRSPNDPKRAAAYLRSLLRWLGRLALAVCFLVSVVLGALIHLDLPVSRRAAGDLLERILNQSLEGTIRIGSVSHLVGQGVSATDLEMLDPEGRTTLRVAKLVAEIDLLDILDRVFGDHEKLSIQVTAVKASGCEIYFLPTTKRDETGKLLTHVSLKDAFTPTESDTETGSAASSSRPVRVWFPQIELSDVFARGSIAGSPVVEARATHMRATVLASDKGAAVDVSQFDLQASGIGGVDIQAQGETHVRAPGAVWGEVTGRVGEVPVNQLFRYENGQFKLETRARLEPADVRPLWSEWPLDRPINIENSLEGTAERFSFEAKVRGQSREHSSGDDGETRLTGEVFLDGSEQAELSVITKSLNLQSLLSSLPPTRLDSTSQLRIDWPGGIPFLNLESHIEPGLVANTPTPTIDAIASWKSDKWTVDATLTEPGLKAYAHAEQTNKGPYIFEVRLPATELHHSERLASLLGEVKGTAEGTIRGSLTEQDYSANLDIDLRRLQLSGASLNSGRLTGEIQGNLDHLEQSTGETQLNLAEANFAPVHLRQVKVLQHGPLLTPIIELSATTARELQLTARGDVAILSSSVSNFTAKIEGDGQPLEARASSIAYTNETLTVRDFFMRSIGEISGELEYNPQKGYIKAQARDLNISRIGQSLGLAQTEMGGDLDADVDLHFGQNPQGRIDVSVREGALRGITGIRLAATATVDGNQVNGEFSAGIEGLGDVESTWDARLTGGPLKAASYHGATGRWLAEVNGLDLKTLSLLLGNALPVDSMSGSLDLTLDVNQREGDEFPEVQFSGSTHGFTADWESEEKRHSIEFIDANIAATIPSGGEKLESAIRLNDRHGMLLSLSGEIGLPLDEWLRSFPSSDQLLGELGNGNLNVVAIMPRRDISTWPDFFPHFVDQGEVSARLAFSGSVSSPEVGIVFIGTGLDGGQSPLKDSVDVNLKARYLATPGTLRGNLSVEHESHRLGETQFDLVIPFAHLVSPPPNDTPFWTGTAQLQLESTPLQLVEAIDKLKLQGLAQGTIRIDRSELASDVIADLQLRRLEAGDRSLGDATFEMHTHENDLITRMEFTDDYGSLFVSAEVAMLADTYFMSPHPEKQIFLSLRSEKYDAAVLQPFVVGIFDELSGALNGKLSAELTPPQGPEDVWKTSVSGRMDLSDGVLVPSALGLRLTDTRLTINAEREGEFNLVRMENISARADSTEANVQGRAELYFRNIAFQGGNFELNVQKAPLMAGGATLANVSGGVSGQFTVDKEAIRLGLVLDSVEAELPEVSETNLIDVTDNPTIDIVQRAAPVKDVEESSEALPLVMQINLGNNVRVKNSILDLRLRGTPTVTLDDDTQLAGTIELVRGGRVIVLGRSFVVSRGSVMFDTGEATNPHLNVVANWTAPNGVVVRVEVGGTVKEPTLTWGSEPALPGGEADVIALVLGSGSGGGEQVGITSLAIAANEAIGASGVGWMEFYATQEMGSGEGRVAGLTDSSWNNYTAAFRINDDLWFEGNFQSTSAGFQTGEQQTGVSGTLDWRFHPQWALRTEIGTLGGGLDLVWQYRY